MDIEKRLCKLCLIEKPLTQFGKCYNRGKVYLTRKWICESCKKKRIYYKLRENFLRHFEYKCQCCGENDVRFLTLDHVQNDGHLDKDLTQIQLYRKAWEDRFNKERWSCLCWNCNCGRSQNGDVCPHKDKITKEEYLLKLRERIGDIKGIDTQRQIEYFSRQQYSEEELVRLIKKLQQ